MSNASTATAKRGYEEIFLKAAPRPSEEALNELLKAKGCVEGIGHRTFVHYGRLDAHGERTYIPINEFDIRRKHEGN